MVLFDVRTWIQDDSIADVSYKSSLETASRAKMLKSSMGTSLLELHVKLVRAISKVTRAMVIFSFF